MKLGNINIEGAVALGPMAGVTDRAFREICKSFGCGLMFTEMVSAKAFYYEDEKTKDLMVIDEGQRPVGLQIFGHEPEIMADMVSKLHDFNHDILDINMGCPAPKIVKNGDGSALMDDLKLVEAIVKAVVAASNKPVSVKIRKGFSTTNAVEIAKIIESAGADFITIHGRTRNQFYAGKADWDIIKKVKKSVSIPVIGNGDVFSAEDALAMKDHTDVDGIMVARGVQGNPWLIEQINTYFKTGKLIDGPSPEEKIRVALEHLKLMIEYKGSHRGLMEMRKHAAWYLKGIRGSSKVKEQINRAKNQEEVVALLRGMVSQTD
jgi:tRNA-dihydrouridine synthase B